jgi:hypothetical protein
VLSCHDYVPFYFGPLSVMLFNLKTGRVAGYTEGQAPLIYLTTTIARVREAGCRFVFSDGHGLASFTDWYDDLARLDQVDWGLVRARYWADQPDDNDRKRRKQAEFLVWKLLDWPLVEGSIPNRKHHGIAIIKSKCAFAGPTRCRAS